MTHEELLQKLTPARYIIKDEVVAQLNALRAVVELAYKVEKFEDVQFWTEEAIEAYKLAMRRTIQAIEKELK